MPDEDLGDRDGDFDAVEDEGDTGASGPQRCEFIFGIAFKLTVFLA